MIINKLISAFKNHLAELRTEKRPRILALDLIRGLFLIIIFADHISYAPSLFFQYATHASAALASAAEGFFVISGILVGYIYGPRILKKPAEVTKKLLKRAGLLYALIVIFTLFYTAWALLLPDGYPRAETYPASFIEIVFRTLTLQYQFGWADFLSRYAVFMAIAPIVLWLIAKHQTWLVAIVSFAVWYLYHNIHVFQFYAAWQLIFVAGVIIGYYLPSIESVVKKIPRKIAAISWWSIVGVAGITYVATVLWITVFSVHLSLPGVPPELLPYFEKNPLAKGRIVVGILWFLGIYLIFRRYERQINKLTKSVLLVFGQNSLFVYSFSAFVIFSMDVLMLAPEGSPLLLNTIIGILGTYFIYIVTKHRADITRWINYQTKNLLH